MGRLRDDVVIRWRAAKEWVCDGWLLWLWLSVAAMLLAISYEFPATYFGFDATLSGRVRWSGMTFQLVGLIPALIGLDKASQLFFEASLSARARRWLARSWYIVWPRQRVGANIVVGVGTARGHGGAAFAGDFSGGTVEDRVKWLQDVVEQIRKDQRTIRQEIRGVRSEIARDRQERRRDHQNLSEKVQEATVGDTKMLHLLTVGRNFFSSFSGLHLRPCQTRSLAFF